jgi:prepilin-type processing-associated H-X9-DG protein
MPNDTRSFPRTIIDTDQASSFDQMERYCNLTSGVILNFRGEWWGQSIEDCGYEHTRTPNAKEIDCVCILSPMTRNTQVRFSIAARSEHSGGVNIATFDGSVKWIASSITLNTWQALGTHQGHEILDSNGVE